MCIVVTTFGNLLVLVSFVVERQIRQPTNFFIGAGINYVRKILKILTPTLILKLNHVRILQGSKSDFKS